VLPREEDCYVDPTIDPPPVEKCPKCGGELKGCEDVFDTWMDSSGTPLYNAFWLRDNELFKKLYPMDLRPNAHDIIRTWDFYSIVRGWLETGKNPFKEFMIDGFILAPDGRPMHSHLGNVVDPLDVIEEYGTEALRYYAATCSLGEDNAFRWQDVKRGVRFAIKILNIGKFVGEAIKGWKPKEIPWEKLHTIDRWILSLYTKVIKQVTEAMDNFRFDRALKTLENFTWNIFADEYIEMVKYRVYALKDEAALYTLYTITLGIIKMLAPILPHVTEEVYQNYFKAFVGEISIHATSWPEPLKEDKEAEKMGDNIKEIVASIRRWKASKGMSLATELSSIVLSGNLEQLTETDLKDIKNATRAKEISIIPKDRIKERIVEIKPNYKLLGPRFREKAKVIAQKLKSGKLTENGIEIEIDGEKIVLESKYYDVIKELYVEGLEMDDIISIPNYEVLVGIKL